MKQSRSYKATPCPYKPIFCQEGWCEECQIYREYQQRQTSNPYPGTLIDESSGSGVEVLDIRHQLWEEGHRVGIREAQDGIWDKVMGAKKSGFDEGTSEGRREVVDWINNRYAGSTTAIDDKWLAQLKVWGIE